MTLSQIPTVLLKRCYSCINSSGYQLRKEVGRSSNMASKRIEKNEFSTLAKLYVDEDCDDSNPDYVTAKLQTIKSESKVENNMPRLEQLRKRLADENGTSTNASFLNTANSISPNNSNKITKSLGVEVTNNKLKKPSWRDVLATAKEHLSQNEHVNLLTDAYSRKHSYLRISLGERCNLRCLYCMPPEGVPLQSNEKILKADEISRLVKLFTAKGVDKVSVYCFTESGVSLKIILSSYLPRTTHKGPTHWW